MVSGRLLACLFVTLASYSVSLEAKSQQLWLLKGHFVQGGHAYGLTDLNSEVWLHNRKVTVDSFGRFVIGFSWNAPSVLKLRVKSEIGAEQTFDIRLAERSYPSQNINGVPKSTVNPDTRQQQRIKEESNLMKALRHAPPTFPKVSEPTNQNNFDVWRQPIEGRVTSGYGEYRVFNGQVTSRHYGQDIAAKTGVKVAVSKKGRVLLAEELLLSGHTVVIDHGFGLLSSYLHLSKIDVREGQEVSEGQILGRVGSTGRATGPHLDWRVSWYDVRLDPALFLVSPKEWQGRY